MSKATFHKSEKLKSRKQIAQLFESGKPTLSYPVKALWKTDAGQPGTKIKAGFTAPKRNFKRATDRNLLKRRMREAYRLNKHSLVQLCEEHNCTLDVMFIFTASKTESFDTIQKAIQKILSGISHKIDS